LTPGAKVAGRLGRRELGGKEGGRLGSGRLVRRVVMLGRVLEVKRFVESGWQVVRSGRAVEGPWRYLYSELAGSTTRGGGVGSVQARNLPSARLIDKARAQNSAQ
jgi:hypothetical protein